MEYPLNTILRFYPDDSDIHYSAVITKNGILEIKCPNRERKLFYSIQYWLNSLPGMPTLEQILINNKRYKVDEEKKEVNIEEKKEKKEKKKKEKKEIKKCNVPKRNCRIHSLPWARHIHSIIKEFSPELLKNELVIDAYNNLVECLSKYNNHIHTWNLNGLNKYSIGINITLHTTVDKTFIRNAPIYRINNDAVMNYDNIFIDIYNTYQSLYELIKNDILPKLEHKYHELFCERVRKNCVRKIKLYKNLYLNKILKLDEMKKIEKVKRDERIQQEIKNMNELISRKSQ